MRVLVWIAEAGWEASVDAAAMLPAREITLLHVAAPVHPGPVLLGRHPPPGRYDEIAGEAARELLAAATERLRTGLAAAGDAPAGSPGDAPAGSPGAPVAPDRNPLPAAGGRAPTVHRIAAEGRPEDIVTGACSGADVLVLARSGRRPGPHSLEHANRFIVDHAPCTVVLTWP
jgi:hypothetical protein